MVCSVPFCFWVLWPTFLHMIYRYKCIDLGGNIYNSKCVQVQGQKTRLFFYSRHTGARLGRATLAGNGGPTGSAMSPAYYRI